MVLSDIFISHRAQDDYENLRSAIKLLKQWKQRNCLNLSSLQIEKRLILEVSQFLSKKENDEVGLTYAINSWFRAEKYTKKYNDYKRLANELRLQKISPYLLGSLDTIIDNENLNRKIALAERLFALANKLSNDYSLIEEQQFDLLEIELAPLLTSKDYLVLNASGVRKRAETLIDFLSRKATYFLVRIVRKLRRSHKRDVREQLREVVRFHFKNMDDESDAIEIFHCRSKNFITSKSFYSWILNKQLKNCITY